MKGCPWCGKTTENQILHESKLDSQDPCPEAPPQVERLSAAWIRARGPALFRADPKSRTAEAPKHQTRGTAGSGPGTPPARREPPGIPGPSTSPPPSPPREDPPPSPAPTKARTPAHRSDPPAARPARKGAPAPARRSPPDDDAFGA